MPDTETFASTRRAQHSEVPPPELEIDSPELIREASNRRVAGGETAYAGRSSALVNLRRWWVLPCLLALIGSVAAGLSGASTDPRATTVLQVSSSSSEAQALQQSLATAVLEVQTTRVFSAAAQVTGGSASDLRRRTQVASLSNSAALSITVTAGAADRAVREANAVATAAIQANEDRLEEDLVAFTRQTRDLITKSEVSDAAAERARVARLGDELGASQSALMVGRRQLTVLQPAEESNSTTGPALLAALGFVGGGLAGGIAALLLGSRRGRITSALDLQRLYPQLPVVSFDSLDFLVSTSLGSASNVVIAGLRQRVNELQDVTSEVCDRLRSAGYEVEIADPPRLASVPSASRVRVVSSVTLDAFVVGEMSHSPSVATLIVVRPHQTRLEWLTPYAQNLGNSSYLLVADRNVNWEW